MKYPALDVTGVDADLLEAIVDDFSPTAAEQRDRRTTFYFADARHRTGAGEAIARAWPEAVLATREVDDEDWARRSQENLTPISVGRITVSPPWHVPPAGAGTQPGRESPSLGPHSPSGHAAPESITLVIAPSMGFGTGHHATTRLCLAALQAVDLTNRLLLDVGTGSGVLAIAGRALGAREAVGVDYDADAIQSANENLEANPHIDGVRFVLGDLRTVAMTPADVVTANLTGALLVQSAALLLSVVRPGGTIIVSGLLAHEREDVVAAVGGAARLAWEAGEQGWLGLAFNSGMAGAV